SSQPEGTPRRGGKRQEKRAPAPKVGFRLVAFLALLAGILFQLFPAGLFGRSREKTPPSASGKGGEGLGVFASRPQGGPQEGGAGHETRDLSVPWVFGIVGFLAVSGIAIQFILAGMLSGLKSKPAPRDRFTPIEQVRRAAGPPAQYPRLQVSPPADLQTFRQREETELDTYGWVNQSSGVVRLPIERAMDLLMEQGLPVREGEQGGQTGPSSYDLIQKRLPQDQPKGQGEK
ncbi:MAG TPA: hypothetical protein VNZ22_13735, partial [Bacillota bacterium]|nr:hypothetical protein [Bacillota bacterium]